MPNPTPQQQRDALVAEHQGLARALAGRFRGRGETDDDLTQVAMLGLVAAANRFDRERGEFAAFAAPTILGELRRHFRDRTWQLKVPRGQKDDYVTVSRAIDSLSEEGGSPSVRRIADATGLDEERVLDAILAGRAYRTDQFVESPADDDAQTAPAASTGAVDPGYEHAETRIETDNALAVLGTREREIIAMRFEQGLSQAEIGERMGLSQVHISRLLRASLLRLREHMERDADDRTTTR